LTREGNKPAPQTAGTTIVRASARDPQEQSGNATTADRSHAREDLKEAVAWLKGVKCETWIVLGLATALVLGWEWIASQFPKAIIPSIGETLEALLGMLRDYRGGYINALANTIQNYYSGLGLAVLVGWTLAGLMGLSGLFGRVMKVVLDFLGNIPLIAFIPLLVALLGLGGTAKIIVVMLAAAIAIATTAQAAFEGVDHGAEEVAMGLGASKLQAQLLVVWPLILPQMIAGLRLGAAQALTACIVAEIYTAMTGLGGLIVGYGASFNMPRYFVAVLTTVIIGSTTAAALRRLEQRFAVP
jgi:NitT/TauT family transport system permease protein